MDCINLAIHNFSLIHSRRQVPIRLVHVQNQTFCISIRRDKLLNFVVAVSTSLTNLAPLTINDRPVHRSGFLAEYFSTLDIGGGSGSGGSGSSGSTATTQDRNMNCLLEHLKSQVDNSQITRNIFDCNAVAYDLARNKLINEIRDLMIINHPSKEESTDKILHALLIDGEGSENDCIVFVNRFLLALNKILCNRILISNNQYVLLFCHKIFFLLCLAETFSSDTGHDESTRRDVMYNELAQLLVVLLNNIAAIPLSYPSSLPPTYRSSFGDFFRSISQDTKLTPKKVRAALDTPTKCLSIFKSIEFVTMLRKNQKHLTAIRKCLPDVLWPGLILGTVFMKQYFGTRLWTASEINAWYMTQYFKNLNKNSNDTANNLPSEQKDLYIYLYGMIENVKETVDSWSRYEFIPEAVVMELSANEDINCLFRDIFNSMEGTRGEGEMEE